MIRFQLRCRHAHDFEAWFGGNDDFDAQRERGLVECPRCGSAEVQKALMAPAVGRRARPVESPVSAPALPRSGAPELTNARDVALRDAMRAIARTVRDNTVDVGARFPEEARRIHYGETEERAIRGRASPAEARALRDEGIAVAPVPVAPDDTN